MFKVIYIKQKQSYTEEFTAYDIAVSWAVTSLSIDNLLWIIYDVENDKTYLGDTYVNNR